MLFAEHDTTMVDVAVWGAAAAAAVTVLGTLFTGLGALLNSWLSNSNKVKADAILEYKALYDASRSEVHALRNDLAGAQLSWQKQAEADRLAWQNKSDELRVSRDTQVATLTSEVFKLHDEHASCLRESGELRSEIRLLRQQLGVASSDPSTDLSKHTT